MYMELRKEKIIDMATAFRHGYFASEKEWLEFTGGIKKTKKKD